MQSIAHTRYIHTAAVGGEKINAWLHAFTYPKQVLDYIHTTTEVFPTFFVTESQSLPSQCRVGVSGLGLLTVQPAEVCIMNNVE